MSDAVSFDPPAPSPASNHDVLGGLREQGYTGEIVVQVDEEVRIYLDQGRVYLAERASDRPLGERLVEVGALTAEQLNRGSIKVGGTEYLGRLFSRNEDLDRHAVLRATDALNDECMAWLGTQLVRGVEMSSYRRHPSSVHRWDQPSDVEVAEAVAAPPLPPPPPDAIPVFDAPPEALQSVIEAAGVAARAASSSIRWDEPSWLDERTTGTQSRIAAVPTDDGTTSERDWAEGLAVSSDWLEGLGLGAPATTEAHAAAMPAPVADLPAPGAGIEIAAIESAEPSDVDGSAHTDQAPESSAPAAGNAAPSRRGDSRRDEALRASPLADVIDLFPEPASADDTHSDVTNDAPVAEVIGFGGTDEPTYVDATGVDEADRTAALRRLVGGLRSES